MKAGNRMLKVCAKGRIAECKVIDVLANHGGRLDDKRDARPLRGSI